MGSEILTLATGAALLALIVSAFILCLAAIWVLFKLYPEIRRILSNLEKTTASTAVIGENIAGASSLLGPAGTVANVLKMGKDLLTDEQKRELVNRIKEKLQSIDARGSVDSVTGKIRDLLRQRPGR